MSSPGRQAALRGGGGQFDVLIVCVVVRRHCAVVVDSETFERCGCVAGLVAYASARGEWRSALDYNLGNEGDGVVDGGRSGGHGEDREGGGAGRRGVRGSDGDKAGAKGASGASGVDGVAEAEGGAAPAAATGPTGPAVPSLPTVDWAEAEAAAALLSEVGVPPPRTFLHPPLARTGSRRCIRLEIRVDLPRPVAGGGPEPGVELPRAPAPLHRGRAHREVHEPHRRRQVTPARLRPRSLALSLLRSFFSSSFSYRLDAVQRPSCRRS